MEVFRRDEGTNWTRLTFVAGSVELKSVDVFLEQADVYAEPLGGQALLSRPASDGGSPQREPERGSCCR